MLEFLISWNFFHLRRILETRDVSLNWNREMGQFILEGINEEDGIVFLIKFILFLLRMLS